MPPAAKLALTRRLAAAAQEFRGAPMAHDLVAAAEDLLRDPALLDGTTTSAPAEHGPLGAGWSWDDVSVASCIALRSMTFRNADTT